MKITLKLLLLLSIFSGTMLPAHLNQQNTVFAFDLDDVVIQKTFWFKPNLILGGIALHPFSGYQYINVLFNLKSAYKADADGSKEILYDKQGNEINGLTAQFLSIGMHDARLTPYIAWMLDTINGSRCFITGTKSIILYLKNKGYTIVFATNKDHISYEQTVQTLGNELSSLATVAFVAHPVDNTQLFEDIAQCAQLPSTPTSYRTLAEHTINIQETNTIIHAPGKKPERQYYQRVEKVIGPEKNIIFIDDKKSNIDGFNQLQDTAQTDRIGIQFKNPIQLADELVKLGILSEINDKQFLQGIRNPGILGTIRHAVQRIKQTLLPAHA